MASRIKSLTKLTLLLGTPVALLLGLFGGGVYCGHSNRAAILGFERDWLGFDVEVPGEPTKTEPTKTEPTKVEPPKVEPTPPPKVEPTKTEPTKVEPPKVEPTPPPKVEPTSVPAALVAVTDPVPLTLASPLPLPDDLHGRLAEPVRVRIKVLVDPELVDRRPDWIAYVQRHVAWASQVLEPQIGVRLELRGVVVWSNPTGGDATALRTDLQARARDGADLLLGFSSRSYSGAPTLPVADDFNLGHALVQANPASRAPHLRGMLQALGLALGAPAVIDPVSFMSDVLTPDSQAIGLDAASRRRLLERKSLPFQVEAETPPTREDGEL
jgi:hypothetical protein